MTDNQHPNPAPIVVARRWYQDRTTLALVILTAAIAFSYAAFTSHAWEDYFITFRASKNMALGKGLVFTEGQRVQTFTSPLGTLLPGALSWLTGNHSDLLVLWLFRIVSVAALAAAVAITIQTFRRWESNRFFAICGTLLLATDCKSVDNTINGMETGFMLFFVSLTVYLLSGPLNKRSLAMLAVAFSGLMWTRPDGFISAGSLLVAFFIFRAGAFDTTQGGTELRRVFKAIGWSVVLYLPWVLFALVYYGTPVPNTIVAKNLGSSLWDRLSDIIPLSPLAFSRFGLSIQDTFTPAYERVFHGWPWWVGELSKVVSLVAALHWLFPIAKAPGRAVSLACLLMHIYLSFISPFVFPWYVPPATYLTILSLMSLLEALPSPNPAPPFAFLRQARPGRMLAGGLVGLSTALLVGTAVLYARQEQLTELGNRKRVGDWLHANGAAGDTVFVECLGYIGYYSGLKMYDYPGLSSPEVVSARRKLLKDGKQDDWASIIQRLQPTWLVLRPHEVNNVSNSIAGILGQEYRLRTVFDVREKANQLPNVPGSEYYLYDEVFNVYQKVEPHQLTSK
jgi:hypothetical protein